jgi:peptidoglycan/LPS O-acetylase OafA/YrhL
MRTFGSILDGNRGIGRGFDTLRLVLSISIVCFHSVVVTQGSIVESEFWQSPLGKLAGTLLPAFFALSGFLVMASAERVKSLKTFLALRALRIAPALATEITLSALILGAVFTTLPAADYFVNPTFFAYFGSLIGRVRTNLPGVFDDNPLPNVVNTSLWTIRPELGCYVYIALLSCIGALRSRFLVTSIGIALLAANVLIDTTAIEDEIRTVIPPRLLLLSFVLGNLAFVWRHRIPYSAGLFIAAFAGGAIMIQMPAGASFGALLLTYCTVAIGLTPLPRIPVLSRGDYSYGIYLYGFPIQATISHLWPEARHPFLNIVLALPPIVLIAIASWHLVEKPAMAWRKPLMAADRPVRRTAVETLFVLPTLLVYELYLMGAIAYGDDSGAHHWEVIALAFVAVGTGLCMTAPIWAKHVAPYRHRHPPDTRESGSLTVEPGR